MSTSKVDFSVPGHRSPGVGYEEPFEMLEACHERVQRMLSLLGRARVYAKEHGCDEPFLNAIKDVIRYFDNAAPQHHLDEELHVFPVVLAMDEEHLNKIVLQLQNDHKKMEENWAIIRAMLTLIAKTTPKKPVFSSDQNILIDEFVTMYEKHISLEEDQIYTVAIQKISNDSLASMSKEMALRRGVN
jgi:hemerythrin-like domain-containing protein